MQAVQRGGARKAAARGDPRRRGAFTLLEVLVVVGIVTILVTITFPAASRAREMGRRARCASNLHALGVGAHQFAMDHDAIYPAAYYMPDAKYPYRFPTVISRNVGNEAVTATWRQYGTPWQTYVKYGMTEDYWQCPSSLDRTGMLDTSNGCPPEYGPIYKTNYMWLAGMTPSNCGKSQARWGSAIPAVTMRDPNVADRILAADMVFFSGGAGNEWDLPGKRYRINHARAKGTLPDYQAILYADGRVDSKGREYYPKELNATNNYSLRHSGPPAGGYMYWGPSKSGTAQWSTPQAAKLNVPKPPAPVPATPPPPPPPPTTPAPKPVELQPDPLP